MGHFKNLPRGIKEAIRQNQGFEENDESHDEILNQNNENALWEMYCDWHGLLGWSETLAAALDAIRVSKQPEPKRSHTAKKKETRRNLFSGPLDNTMIIVRGRG